MKVQLLPPRGNRGDTPQIHLTQCLPFAQSKPGRYVHRVRSATIHHLRTGEYSHTSFTAWCGGIVFNDEQTKAGWRPSHKGKLFAEPPVNEIVCATCEGRAIGSGQAGAPVICGRPVKYSPRSLRP